MSTIPEAIELLRGFDNQHVAVAIWCEDDVLELAKEKGIKCSRKRAQEIIDKVDRKQDATLGISWDTVSVYLGEYVWDKKKYRE
ncbi:MAG: hypothetical protein ISS54_06905 [Dehalococcoidia bacterium]|nr:hypothetical protein [Dehalococcoidia bacterium]